MLAAVETTKGLCVVYWTGRQGLSVKARVYCGEVVNAADGVLQVPDNAHVCVECDEAVKRGTPNQPVR
jgi:hypothetical protein